MEKSAKLDNRRLGRIIRRKLDRDPGAAGKFLQLMLLSGPNDSRRTKDIGTPIANAARDKNGQPTAWVQFQRYIPSSCLDSNPATTDDLQASMSLKS